MALGAELLFRWFCISCNVATPDPLFCLSKRSYRVANARSLQDLATYPLMPGATAFKK